MTQENSYGSRPWLSNYEKGVPPELDYEETCLPEFLDRAAGRYPDNLALIFQGYKVSYRQLKDMVDRFATALYDFGIKKGDRSPSFYRM